jgi:SAM-dependent methyltransferase
VIADKPAPEINVDKLMREIREAIPHRDSLHRPEASIRMLTGGAGLDLEDIAVELGRIAPGVDPPAPVQLSLSESDWQSIPTPLPRREEAAYHFRDFLAYDDLEFVRAAYQAILKREADVEGLRCYLAMLQDGASKAEILHRICQSPEGRQKDVRIGGLRLPYALDLISRLPIVGRLIAIAVAIWNLPGAERGHRRTSRELARRLTQNEQYSARNAKTATDALRRLERSQNALADMTKLFATRAQSESLQRALSGTVASLQALQKATKTHVAKGLFDAQIDELRANIETKAESTAVEAANRQIQRISETKADRRDSERWAKDVGASIRTIAEAKADTAELAQVQTAIEDVAQKLELIQELKASSVDLRNLEVFLLSATEAKAERHEITALTNRLVALLEHRATKTEFEFVRSSMERTNDAIDNIRRDKANISDLDGLGVEMKRESRIVLEEVERAVQDLANTKADQAAIVALRLELSASVEDSSTAAKEALQGSINEWYRKLDSLSQSKADRTFVVNLKAEVNDSLEQASRKWMNRLDEVVAEKADNAVVEAVKAEANVAITLNQKSAADALTSALAVVNSQAHDLKRNVLDQDRRVGLLLEEARKRFPKPISGAQIGVMLSEDDHRFDAMYASFEDQFRGTRADIRRRQAVYLPLVREAKAGTAKAPVIDVGCGRGEWLELLRDEGFVARGVDLNHIFLDGCRELKLDVSEQDALSFLRQLKRDSVGLLTSFHMIEHLDHKILIALLDETLRVLRPGGIAIFETPNPRNVVVGSCNFYLDPTHKRPLPPDLSRYLLEARGFGKVEVQDLHPCAEEQMVSEGAQKVRDVLNHMLYSAQDYAVIGRKV